MAVQTVPPCFICMLLSIHQTPRRQIVHHGSEDIPDHNGPATWKSIAANCFGMWASLLSMWGLAATAKHTRKETWSKTRSPKQIYRIRNRKRKNLERRLGWKLRIRKYPRTFRRIVQLYLLLAPPTTSKRWHARTSNLTHAKHQPFKN